MLLAQSPALCQTAPAAAPNDKPAGITYSALAAVAGTGHVYAVGSQGAVAASFDGGWRWTLQKTPTRDTLCSVRFADSLHGWAVGSGGAIIATNDGGAHWTLQRSPAQTQGALASVDFVDCLHGWAVGPTIDPYQPGGPLPKPLIIATIDGGQHWNTQIPPQNADALVSVSFADSRHGWAVGSNGTVIRTTDGTHWVTAANPQDSGIGSNQLSSVEFVDCVHGFALANGETTITYFPPGEADIDPGMLVPATFIYATSDGGHQWTQIWGGQSDPTFNAISFTSATRGFLVGESASEQGLNPNAGAGVIIFTLDDGHTWQSPRHMPGGTPIAICFADSERGWILDTNDAVLNTTDGGAWWRTVPLPQEAASAYR